MRDYLLFLFVFGSVPFILTRPHIGVLMWSLFSYLNPHRLTWGAAFNFPFSQVIGAATLVSLLFSSEKKTIPWSPMVVIWFVFIAWMCVTTAFALYPELAMSEWERTMKIQLFAVVTVIVMQGKERLNYLILVIVASLGFYGIKGGIFSVSTGGSFRVWGPPGSFIEGNNELGLALVMILPLIWYLYTQQERKGFKIAVLSAAALTSLSILTTHSRGALVSILAMMLFLWWKSRQKLVLGIAMLVAAPVLWLAMPEHWHERMATIQNYEEDGSALGRINAWHFAYNLAVDRPVIGGGFQTFMPDIFHEYAPEPENFHDAHSIYFEVLAEHGFVGLTLFLGLGVATFFTAGRIRKRAKGRGEMAWVIDLAGMLQVSLVGYAVGGLFLGLAYFDLYYHLVAIVAILNGHVSNVIRVDSADTSEGRLASSQLS